MNFTFNVNGKLITVKSRDQDRARSAAKKQMGANWSPKAKLVSVSNSI